MKTDRDDKLEKVVKIEQQLGEIQDIDILLEQILTETRKIVNADAGSIYVCEKNMLRIKYGQNDTQLKRLDPGKKLPFTNFSFPINEQQICGYVALKKETLNIDDCYKLSGNETYKFNKNSDLITNYRTTSMFTTPLKMANGKLLGVLQIINAKDKDGNFIPFDEEASLLITHFASNVVQALEHANLTSDMVRRMLKMTEFRDPKETYTHVERVSYFAQEIYDRYAFNKNISPEEVHKFRDNLKIATKFHDVGKIGISDTILKKPARFTDEERNIMKCHTVIGAQLFDPPESPLDQMCLDISLHHHDRWDGDLTKGYPGNISLNDFSIKDFQLKEGKPISGTEIPLSARICAVADVFDALSHKRCYKDSWSLEDSFAEIERSSGSHFDPEVVEAFMQVKDRITAILNAYPDE